MGAPGDPWGRPPAALAVACIAPVHAGDLWLVYSEGEKPSRIFVVVDETYLDALPFSERTCQLHHHPGKSQGARLGLLEHAHRLRSQDPGGAAHPGLAARRQAHHRARPAGAPGEQPGRRGVDRLRLRTGTEGWRPAAHSATGRDRQSRAGTDVPGTADDERGRRRSKRRRPRRSGSPACRRRWHVPRRTRTSAGCSARSIETRGCVAQARRGSLRCRSYRCARNVRQVIPCG